MLRGFLPVREKMIRGTREIERITLERGEEQTEDQFFSIAARKNQVKGKIDSIMGICVRGSIEESLTSLREIEILI